MDNKRRKEIKRQIEELKKNPQMEIYSEVRAMWETIVMNAKNNITQIEVVLKFERAMLELKEKKLKEIIDEEKNKG